MVIENARPYKWIFNEKDDKSRYSARKLIVLLFTTSPKKRYKSQQEIPPSPAAPGEAHDSKHFKTDRCKSNSPFWRLHQLFNSQKQSFFQKADKLFGNAAPTASWWKQMVSQAIVFVNKAPHPGINQALIFLINI